MASPTQPNLAILPEVIDIRTALAITFERLGGTDALVTWAQDNQTLFYTQLWSKLLTKDVTAQLGHNGRLEISWVGDDIEDATTG